MWASELAVKSAGDRPSRRRIVLQFFCMLHRLVEKVRFEYSFDLKFTAFDVELERIRSRFVPVAANSCPSEVDCDTPAPHVPSSSSSLVLWLGSVDFIALTRLNSRSGGGGGLWAKPTRRNNYAYANPPTHVRRRIGVNLQHPVLRHLERVVFVDQCLPSRAGRCRRRSVT